MSFRTLSLFLPVLLLCAQSNPAFAGGKRNSFNDGMVPALWRGDNLEAALTKELSELDSRRSAAVAAYNDLGVKLNQYHGWCSTYGLTALRSIIEMRVFMRTFSMVSYPFYYVYSNDPYFSGMRDRVDQAVDSLRTTKVDVGKCALTEDMVIRMGRDPKHFDPSLDESSGSSFAYTLLAGNFRLIEEERAILLELRGVIQGARTGGDWAAVRAFVEKTYQRLQEKTAMLRARTLQEYEMSFRIPLGPLEAYKGKTIGQSDTDKVPNFFWVFERRAFYVNQARMAAGKLFDVSVRHFTAAEAIQERFLSILQESYANR